MKTTYDTTAFAKINIFLRCCGKFPNGYHRLYMLMQEIGLGDDILVETDDEKEYSIDIDSDVDIPKEKDLGYKAAKAFYDAYEAKLKEEGATDIKFPYTRIKETKNVPSQAGLGGGSSDAAAILMILQQHFGNPFRQSVKFRRASCCKQQVRCRRTVLSYGRHLYLRGSGRDSDQASRSVGDRYSSCKTSGRRVDGGVLQIIR